MCNWDPEKVLIQSRLPMEGMEAMESELGFPHFQSRAPYLEYLLRVNIKLAVCKVFEMAQCVKASIKSNALNCDRRREPTPTGFLLISTFSVWRMCVSAHTHTTLKYLTKIHHISFTKDWTSVWIIECKNLATHPQVILMNQGGTAFRPSSCPAYHFKEKDCSNIPGRQ